MTQNQISYWNFEETQRHNKAAEAIGETGNLIQATKVSNDYALGTRGNELRSKEIGNNYVIGMMNAQANQTNAAANSMNAVTNRQGMKNAYALGLLGNETTRRGQDIQQTTTMMGNAMNYMQARYNTDQTQQTIRQNNAWNYSLGMQNIVLETQLGYDKLAQDRLIATSNNVNDIFQSVLGTSRFAIKK